MGGASCLSISVVQDTNFQPLSCPYFQEMKSPETGLKTSPNTIYFDLILYTVMYEQWSIVSEEILYQEATNVCKPMSVESINTNFPQVLCVVIGRFITFSLIFYLAYLCNKNSQKFPFLTLEMLQFQTSTEDRCCSFIHLVEMLYFYTSSGDAVVLDIQWRCCSFGHLVEMLQFQTSSGDAVVFLVREQTDVNVHNKSCCVLSAARLPAILFLLIGKSIKITLQEFLIEEGITFL